MKGIFKFQVLAPKCSKDERPKVLEAYIKLLSLPPTFKVTGLFLSDFYPHKLILELENDKIMQN